jgi:Mor family transcriptional regulator
MKSVDSQGRVWNHQKEPTVQTFHLRGKGYNWKLSEALPDIYLRFAKGESTRSIAKLYGVSETAIYYRRRKYMCLG